MCIDEDNNRQLAVKEVWVDPNYSNDTRKVCKRCSILKCFTYVAHICGDING